MQFDGRTILIAGGAPRTGASLARAFAARGATTVRVAGEGATGKGAAGRRDHVDALINLIEITGHGASEGSIAAARETALQVSRSVFSTSFGALRDEHETFVVNVALLAAKCELVLPPVTAEIARTVEAMTRGLAHQLAPKTRVNAVLFDEARALEAASYASATHREPSEDTAYGPILFLASAGARHMTGTFLTADAGNSLGFASFKPGVRTSA